MSSRRSRKPLPGYPVEEPFMSREAIENYLSDDRILCLICGRPFKALTNHLSIHDMTADEYKDKYNIPYSHGLARETTRKLLSKAARNLYDTSAERREHMARIRTENAEARRIASTKPRPKRDFVIAEHTRRGILLAGHETQFSDTEKAAFLAALDKGMTQEEATAHIGYSKSGLFANLRKDPAFQEAARLAIEAQPFPLQARQQRLGKRFSDECRRLLKKGYSDHAIAGMLGVTAMSVNRRTKKMRAGQ